MLRLLVFAVTCAVANAMAQDAALAGRIESYLQPYVAGKNFIGAVLVAQDGKVLFSRAYGNANYSLSVPNSPATKFHIASISKPFTAAAVLKLEQRKLLRLEDPVSKYVPDFNRGGQITLRHLLTHTSGIPNVNDMPEYQTASRLPQSPSSLVDLFKRKALNFEPGSKYQYSNSNYNLLALVIEKVSGKSYGEFIRTEILEPAQMRDTGHDGNAADVIPNAAAGYQPRGVSELENAPYIDWSSKTGNGSLYSTTADVLRFIQAYAHGLIVPGEAVKQIWTEKSGNNFGWFVRKSQGELAVSTNGRSPGFTSSATYYPGRGLTVIVLSNSYSPVSQSPIADDIAAMALGKTVPSAGKIVPVPLDPEAFKKVVGVYRFGPDFFRPNAEVRLTLHSGEPVLDWGSNFYSVLIPVAPGEFVDRQFWARVRVKSDGSGFVYSSAGSDFDVVRSDKH